MQKLIRTSLLALAIIIVGAVGSTAWAADPVVGSWQLNAARSSGTPYRSQTRTYTESSAGISLEMKTTTTDGKESTSHVTYRLDGKDYPVTGAPDYDSLSAQQINATTAEFTLKRGGKTVGTTTRTLSADGRTLTTTLKLTTAGGQKMEGTLVFDRQ